MRAPSVEASDIAEHFQERGPHAIQALGEQAIQRTSLVLQASLRAAYTETHVTWLRSHFKYLEQPTEVWIRPSIEYHEAGINREQLTIEFDVDRVGMSAGIVVRFKYRNIVSRREQASRQTTANPRTYHRDSHVLHSLP